MQSDFTFSGTVTEEEQAFYHRYGFIVYRKYASSAEVAALTEDAEMRQQELRNGIGLENSDTVAPRSVLPDGLPIWHRLNYFTEHSSTANAISRNWRIAAIGEGLGGPNYWLLRDSMNGAVWQVKLGAAESKYKQIRWHQDFGAGHILSPAFTAGLYLHESNQSNGCLAVVPMSHRWPLRSLPRERFYVEAHPGDLVCHHERLFHGSGAMRRVNDLRATLYFYLCSGAPPEARRVFASEQQLKAVRGLFSEGDEA